jgi:hypothetical protein
MGIILGDLVHEDRTEYCNWWNWRPTLVLIAQSGVLDSDRLERMAYNGGGAEITAQEARRIADFVEVEVLPKLGPRDEVKLDGRISDEPRWMGSISEVPDVQQLYGACRDWLVTLVRFCRECNGFGVY